VCVDGCLREFGASLNIIILVILIKIIDAFYRIAASANVCYIFLIVFHSCKRDIGIKVKLKIGVFYLH